MANVSRAYPQVVGVAIDDNGVAAPSQTRSLITVRSSAIERALRMRTSPSGPSSRGISSWASVDSPRWRVPAPLASSRSIAATGVKKVPSISPVSSALVSAAWSGTARSSTRPALGRSRGFQ